MTQVKYIAAGVKTDSVNGAGLRWEPGQIRTVSPELAERLLAFSDTWERVAGEDGETQPIGLKPKDRAVDEPLPVVDLHAMGKKAMIEYADTTLGVKLDKSLTEAAIRHKVTDLLSKHHADEAEDNEAAAGGK